MGEPKRYYFVGGDGPGAYEMEADEREPGTHIRVADYLALRAECDAAKADLAKVEVYMALVYNGPDVYANLDDRAKTQTSVENISDVQDAMHRAAIAKIKAAIDAGREA